MAGGLVSMVPSLWKSTYPALLILLLASLIRDLKMSPLISPTTCHFDGQLSPWPTNRQQNRFHRAIPSSILVQFASEGCARLIRFNRMRLLRHSPESVSGWQALEMVMEKNITRQDNTVSVTSPSAHTVWCRIWVVFLLILLILIIIRPRKFKWKSLCVLKMGIE